MSRFQRPSPQTKVPTPTIDRDKLFWTSTEPSAIDSTLFWALSDVTLMPFYKAITEAHKARTLFVLCGPDSAGELHYPGFYCVEESGFSHKSGLLTCLAVHPRYRKKDYSRDDDLGYRHGPNVGFGMTILYKTEEEGLRLPASVTVHQKSVACVQLTAYQSRLFPGHYGAFMMMGDEELGPRTKSGLLKTFRDYPRWYDLDLRDDH